MSRRKNTRTAMFRRIAEDIEGVWPDHAAYLRSLAFGQAGKRGPDGWTALVKQQAKLWRGLQKIADEGERLEICMERAGVNEDTAANFIALSGYDELRAYLKTTST